MKVFEGEKRDKYGRYPTIWVSGADATPQKIYDWLWNHGYQDGGFKFVVVIDLSHDEYEVPDKQTPVYFMDEAADEVLEYLGVDRVRDWLQEKEKARAGL